MAKSEVQDNAEEVVVEKASKVESHRVRGRNMCDVVSQLVTKYNSSNGWSVVKVSPTLLTFEVVLERSVTQGEGDAVVDVDVNSISKEDAPDEKEDEKEDEKKATEKQQDVLVEEGAEKQAPKTAKKASATSAKKLSEAKKV